ncbi:MAG: hypothetical protein RJA10_44 [Pseudomonadota bacterium]|jgi:hypothetical protein
MPPVAKIAKLPPELRQWLHETFVQRAFGDIENITAELNALMKEAGVAITIGKSAVGAESLKVRRAQESIAATTRAMQLIADTAPDEADKRGEALNAMVSQGVFEVLLDVQQAAGEEDPADRMALLNKAALASARLTTTSVRQRQWRAEVETKAKAAADAVTKIARTGGLKPEQVREIRSQILGIAQRAAPAPAPETTTP